jgi:hypothetical protein
MNLLKTIIYEPYLDMPEATTSNWDYQNDTFIVTLGDTVLEIPIYERGYQVQEK